MSAVSDLINNPMVQNTFGLVSQAIDSFKSLDEKLVFNVLFLNHAFIVALMVKRAFEGLKSRGLEKIPFVAGWLLCFAIGTGGAILTSLLLGKPQIFFDVDVINLYLTW